jgi:hypothetical protein
MTGVLMAGPNGTRKGVSADTGNKFGFRYHKELIEGPPRNYQEIAISRGLISGYEWAESMDDLRETILTIGPAHVVIPWYDSMFDASDGRIKVVIDTEWPASHAMMIRGYHPAVRLGRPLRPALLLRNSWGRWGKDGSGDAWIAVSDFERLIASTPVRPWDGTAWVPIAQSKPIDYAAWT